MWYDVPGCVEEWHIPTKTPSKRVHYRLQTRTVERLNDRHQTVLAMFLGFKMLLYNYTEGMCHYSTHPGTSYHMTQFYQAFPRVSTASDKGLGTRLYTPYSRASGRNRKMETEMQEKVFAGIRKSKKWKSKKWKLKRKWKTEMETLAQYSV